MTRPLVSIIIPTLNEELTIAACLRAVGRQTYPHRSMEVIVVDGGSIDATNSVAEGILKESGMRGVVVQTPGPGTRPANLNAGLALASGEYVCRVDARATIPPDYVEICVDTLKERPEVVVVGGAQIATSPPDAGPLQRGIARALRNPLAMGGARYRRAIASGPADTVYLGSFRTEELRAAGGWDERFLVNEDFELNRRLGRDRVVWFDSRLRVAYAPRAGLSELARQYRGFGRWKAAGWVEAGSLTSRHAILLLAPPAAIAAIVAGAAVHPWVATGLTAAGAVTVDLSVREPASLPERIAGIAAAGIVVTSWYAGVVEQTARRALGQRLLTSDA